MIGLQCATVLFTPSLNYNNCVHFYQIHNSVHHEVQILVLNMIEVLVQTVLTIDWTRKVCSNHLICVMIERLELLFKPTLFSLNITGAVGGLPYSLTKAHERVPLS